MKRASELLGIPVVTIRAWENRYGIISPSRSSGGHRLLSEEDLARLGFLKEQIENNGLKISEAVELLQRSESLPAEQAAEQPVNAHAYDHLVEKLYAELIHFNAAQADQTIDLAFAMYDIEETLRRIVVPVLYRVGTEWESGKIKVVQEHFASETIMRRLSALFRVFPIHPSLPVVLAFCPEGERHHLGLLSFSLFFAQKRRKCPVRRSRHAAQGAGRNHRSPEHIVHRGFRHGPSPYGKAFDLDRDHRIEPCALAIFVRRGRF
ncbi:MerR family transcriptional regulator [Cohnella ginsengisoli]|uniref:MerR family transcriptional regulator n=1 Tax=Cohnella ginsengisoli TaxID=425004 RepID=UPI003B8A8DC0